MYDLTGKQFERLTVIKQDDSRPQGAGKQRWWICKCTCGNTISVPRSRLISGVTRSCGCLAKKPRRIIDLTGEVFGKLTVIGRDLGRPTGKNKPAYWKCKCSCGEICSVRSDHLRSGTTTSCGCINSKGEFVITQLLSAANWNFKRQYNFKDLAGKGNVRLMFDFGILNADKSLRCLIEYQGLQHFKPFNFDSEERFDQRIKYDQIKRDYCKEHNIPLVEITYEDYDNLSVEFIEKRIREAEVSFCERNL